MPKLRGSEVYPFYYGADAATLRIAGDLRRNMTNEEKILWQHLRNKKSGFRFRRQHPINKCIVDFFCPEANLVIEIDGSVHLTPFQVERDIERTAIFNQFGLRVIRFTNSEICNNINLVLETIQKITQERINISSSDPPSDRGTPEV